MPRKPYSLEEKARMMARDIGKGKNPDVFEAMKKKRRRSRKPKKVSLVAIGRRMGIPKSEIPAAASKPKAVKAAAAPSSGELYCVKCKQKRSAVGLHVVKKTYQSKGKEVTRSFKTGKCPVCGTTMQTFTK